MEGICEFCEDVFEYHRSPSQPPIQRFCCVYCYKESIANPKKSYTCKQCHKPFSLRVSAARTIPVYCSIDCRRQSLRRSDPVIVNCKHCKKAFVSDRGPSQPVATYCSSECFEENRSRPKEAGDCPQCGKTFSFYSSWPRKFCSIRCRAKSQAGNNLGEYTQKKPGSKPHSKGDEPYRGPNWQQQRRNARHHAGNTCERCGKTEAELGKQLHVHHIIPFKDFGEERYIEANAVSNLRVLCGSCHNIEEPKLPKIIATRT